MCFWFCRELSWTMIRLDFIRLPLVSYQLTFILVYFLNMCFFLCVIFQISGAIFSFRLKTSWIYVCNFQHELNVLSLFHFVFDQLEVCVTGYLGGVPVDLFIVGPSGAPPRDPSHNGETQFAQCGVEVGTMFGHLVGFVGFLHGFWNWKMNPNKNFLFLMFILEALEGLRRTNVRSYGVYDGPVLGYLVGNSVLAEAGKRVKEAVFTRFFFPYHATRKHIL